MTDSHKSLADYGLPVWFERPTRQLRIQLSLLPEDIYSVLADLKVSSDELIRWHQRGWISFDTQTVDYLEPAQVGELAFVRDVIRSGLSDALLTALFDQLPTPVSANPNLIAFSFTHGWVMPTYTSEPDIDQCIDENVDAWLDTLAAEGRTDRLLELKGSIDYLLEKAGVANVEEDEG